MQQHDTSHWVKSFKPLLENPEFHLAEHLKTNLVPLYWLMHTEGAALEVGCGSARGAILAKRLQPWRKVIGLDIDPGVCELARKYVNRVHGKVEIIQGDVFNIPYSQDDFFGAVFSSGLLEHYSDDDIVKAMKEQLRVAPTVIVSVPTDHYYHQRGQREYGDERMITKIDWMRLFREAGEIVELSFTGGLTEENGIHVVVGRR